MEKIRDLRLAGFSNASTAEMRDYYKKDKVIISSLDELGKLRERIAKSDDINFKKPLWEEIKTLKKVINKAQLDFFKNLRTMQIVVIGAPRGGLIMEHPKERTFMLNPDEPVSLPVHQAKQLIKEGLAKETK